MALKQDCENAIYHAYYNALRNDLPLADAIDILFNVLEEALLEAESDSSVPEDTCHVTAAIQDAFTEWTEARKPDDEDEDEDDEDDEDEDGDAFEFDEE